MIPARRAARVLSALARHDGDTIAVDGVVAHRTVLAYTSGAPVVAWGLPVATEYRVEHRVRYSAALEHADALPVIAVRALCGATIVGPRTGSEVAVLTAPNSVLACVRCAERAGALTRPREAVA